MFLQRYNTEKREVERKEIDELAYGWQFKVIACIFNAKEQQYYLVMNGWTSSSWEIFVPVTEKVYNLYHKIEAKEGE